MKVISPIWLKIGCHGNVPWEIGKTGPDWQHSHKYLSFGEIKADRLLKRDTLDAPWLLINRQFQWTGNGHSQLPLAELGKPSLNIDLLHTTGLNGRP